MKEQVSILSAVLFTFLMCTIIQSCKNECKDVVCENGGTCNEDDGSCACVSGYEGTNCEDAWSDKFLGTYAGIDSCDFEYESTITSITANELWISQLFGLTKSGIANVVATNEIQIAVQTVNGHVVSGTGHLSGSVITIDYKIDDADCQVAYTKK